MAFPATEGYYREVVTAGAVAITDAGSGSAEARTTMELISNATPIGLSSEPVADLESGSAGGGGGNGNDDGDGGDASMGGAGVRGGDGDGDSKDEKDELICELKGQLAALEQTVCALQSNQILGVLDFDDGSASLLSAGGRSRQTSNAPASSEFLEVPRAQIELTDIVPRGNEIRDAANAV